MLEVDFKVDSHSFDSYIISDVPVKLNWNSESQQNNLEKVYKPRQNDIKPISVFTDLKVVSLQRLFNLKIHRPVPNLNQI